MDPYDPDGDDRIIARARNLAFVFPPARASFSQPFHRSLDPGVAPDGIEAFLNLTNDFFVKEYQSR
jgi:hypothetical protein